MGKRINTYESSCNPAFLGDEEIRVIRIYFPEGTRGRWQIKAFDRQMRSITLNTTFVQKGSAVGLLIQSLRKFVRNEIANDN